MFIGIIPFCVATFSFIGSYLVLRKLENKTASGYKTALYEIAGRFGFRRRGL
jgi:hypothetical protein